MGKEVVTWKFYLRLAFTVLTLERVIIGCCEVCGGGGGGGVFDGGVFGGSVVFSGEVGVVRRRSAMGEVSRLSSKNWSRDAIVDRGGGDDIKFAILLRWFELQCHRGDQGVDAKGNDD
ncbi:hypothetical protein Tco_0560839 [Tanacetum coccineum]